MTLSIATGDIKSGSDFTALDEAFCALCGCTEDYACEGGCWWVEDPLGEMIDLCSACLEPRRKGAYPAAAMAISAQKARKAADGSA